MPKFLLPLALSALLIPAVSARESQETKAAEPQPAQQQAEPEKKPDAFKYFFGKEREQRKEPEAQKAPETPKAAPEAPAAKAPESAPAVPVEPTPVAAPEPEEVRPEPPAVAQPETATPAPVAPALQPAPKAESTPKVEEPPKPEEPKADAFQYFFGHAAQPLPEPRKAEPGKPVSAFDYFFGKDGKADQPEEPASPPPV
jgi:hypothetical protein